MATFPSITPTYSGFTKTNQPRVKTIRFQDGFEHRIVFGLAQHQNPKVYNLSFNVSETDSDTIETFLDARGGTESFDFTAPGETSAQKFVCERWRKSIPYNSRAIIDATFREVFEP
jgi:phage-related protein